MKIKYRAAIRPVTLEILFIMFIISAPLQTLGATPPEKEIIDVSGALKTRGVAVPKGTKGTTKDLQALGLTCPIGDPVAYLLPKREGIPEYQIQKMGSTFACHLARFIDAGEKAGATMRVYSGARVFKQPGPGADCQRVPCTPSTHELGCAADLTFNGGRQVEAAQCPGNKACVWAHQNAAQFSLQFRLTKENGFARPEPWHIELAGARGPQRPGEQGYCPESAGTPAPPGGIPSADPSGSDSPSQKSKQKSGNPLSEAMQALRKFLNPEKPPQPPPTPLPTGQPTRYFPDTIASTTTATSSMSTSNAEAINEDSRTPIEVIVEIANPPEEEMIPIPTYVGSNLFAPVQLGSRPPSDASARTKETQIQPPIASQTFTSPDLQTSLVPNKENRETLSILGNLRGALLTLLQTLRLLGWRAPVRMPVPSTELLE